IEPCVVDHRGAIALQERLKNPHHAVDRYRVIGAQIVPLRYIAAREMKKILGSVSSAELTFTTNDARNLLLIRGSS
ncbi:hypothetical protein QQ73_10010, partial [Candidatus Endoriftia persephone str. Guaymas]|nr:hypothetical protein [Candidatus Endoriftia persephone str. Guaymas]